MNTRRHRFAVISNPEKNRFGIQAEGGIETPLFSPDPLQVARLASLFEQEELDPAHLCDVVRDLFCSAAFPDRDSYFPSLEW